MKKPFTKEEQEVMNLITRAHNEFLKLKPIHPNDTKDWVNSIHGLQNVMISRVVVRDYPDVFCSIKDKIRSGNKEPQGAYITSD